MLNKKRLIYANEAYEIARTSGFHNDFARSMADLTSLEEVLEDCTTVDAVEVVHGRWISVEDSLFPGTKEKCSLCGVHKGVGYVYHYCPNCGAKMDGERREGE